VWLQLAISAMFSSLESKEMQKWTWLLEWWTRLGEREREREREVWLQLAISAMFSSLEIKGNAEVDLTIGVMDPAGAGEAAVPRNRLDFSVGFAIYHSVQFCREIKKDN
jgi:hypothetical protein